MINLSPKLDHFAYRLLFELKDAVPENWCWLISGDEIIVTDQEARILSQVRRQKGEGIFFLVARLAHQLSKAEPGARVELPLS